MPAGPDGPGSSAGTILAIAVQWIHGLMRERRLEEVVGGWHTAGPLGNGDRHLWHCCSQSC